jgi:hypothetical protein
MPEHLGIRVSNLKASRAFFLAFSKRYRRLFRCRERDAAAAGGWFVTYKLTIDQKPA